jgi:HK97 gp10 family phage protein
MVIKVLNLKSLIGKFGDISDIDLMPEIKVATRKVQATAKQLAPVDTGALKASIHRKLYPKQQTGVVYTTLEYAPYQEFGTRFMKGKPFMLPAINRNRLGIQRSLEAYIRNKVRGRGTASQE